MTINNPDLFVAGLWDWGFLEPCFRGTRIRPSDIDGVTEHNGHTLFIETKSPGVTIPQGQAIMFKAWQRDGNTVFVIWGHANHAEAIQIYWPTGGGVTPIMDCDNAALASYVSRWFAYTQKAPKHKYTPSESNPSR